MAEAFIAAVAAIGSAIGGTAGAVGIIYAVQIGTALYFAAAIAASAAYSSSQKRRAARQQRDAYNASLQDRLVMTPLAGGQRSRVYGLVRNVEGVLFKATHGADSEWYVLVVSVAGHQVDGIPEVYFDDVKLTLDAEGYVQNAPYARPVTTDEFVAGAFYPAGTHTIVLPLTPDVGSLGVYRIIGDQFDFQNQAVDSSVVGSNVTFTIAEESVIAVNYQHSRAASYARVTKYLGGPAQNLAPYLMQVFPTLVTASDRFAGDACLLVELYASPDAFPTGVPNITALVRGANDIYDPRTGLTGWTDNPALIARDWAYYGFGGNFLADTVRDADVIATANACDVATTFTTPAGSTVRPLYTCNIVCRTDQDPSQSFDEIIESMAGRSGWSGGIMRMRAGVYRAPVALTLTEDWLSGADAITIVPEGPADEAVNIVRATIADSAQAYAIAPAPDVRAEAYITLDGRELPQDLTYGGITDTDHSQHVSNVILREARSALTASLPCNLRAFQLELFDVLPVRLPHFGFADKLFEVADWRFSMQGGVILSLRETGASIFDINAVFSASDATPNTALPNPFDVPVPTGLALASGTAWLLRQADGTVTSQLHVSWVPITDAGVAEGGRVEIRYGLAGTAESTWTTIEVPGGDSERNIGGVLDGATYTVKLRSRNALVRSNWSLQRSEQIIGKTQKPRDVTDLVASVVRSGVKISKDPNPDADRGGMELRLGATWAASTPLFRGDADTWTWPSPPVGTYTVLAKHYDTSENESINATPVVVVVTASDAVQWADIDGRPKLYRVVSRGFNDTAAPVGIGIYDGETNTIISNNGSPYNVAFFTRSPTALVEVKGYNTLGGGLSEANRMAADLNALSSNSLVVIWTNDEPQTNRLLGNLPAAMKRCGASAPVFGSPEFSYRSAYVLIGIPGCKEGNGYESYNGTGDNDPIAWCDVAFSVQAGNYIVTGAGATPRTLADYSYTGSLDATSDLALIARGVVLNGNTATRVASGVGVWVADVYSRDSFVGGAYASAVAPRVDRDVMFGLNADPATNSDYTSIDYAMYLRSDGLVEIFESSVPRGLVGGYASGDVMGLVYDGVTVKYLRNGAVLRSVPAPAGMTLFFDSSFGNVGASLRNIRVGPMSAVTGIDTGQLAPGAATEIRPDFIGSTNGALFTGQFAVVDGDAFVPAYSCQAVIAVVFDGVTNNAGWDGQFGAAVQVFDLTAGVATYSASQAMAAARATYTIKFSAPLIAGHTYRIGLVNVNNPSNFGSGQNFWNVRVFTELIKR